METNFKEVFKSLKTREEQVKYVKELIFDQNNIDMLFCSEESEKPITVKEMIDCIGEEAVINKLIDILSEADDYKCGCIEIDSKKLDELLEKEAKGECSEIEKFILNSLERHVVTSNAEKFMINFVDSTVNYINFVQKVIEYKECKVSDMLRGVITTLLSSFINSKDNMFSKYDKDDYPMLINVVRETGDMIGKSLSDFENTNPELVVMSLLSLATSIAIKNDFTFADMNLIAEDLGIALEYAETSEAESC